MVVLVLNLEIIIFLRKGIDYIVIFFIVFVYIGYYRWYGIFVWGG